MKVCNKNFQKRCVFSNNYTRTSNLVDYIPFHIFPIFWATILLGDKIVNELILNPSHDLIWILITVERSFHWKVFADSFNFFIMHCSKFSWYSPRVSYSTFREITGRVRKKFEDRDYLSYKRTWFIKGLFSLTTDISIIMSWNKQLIYL